MILQALKDSKISELSYPASPKSSVIMLQKTETNKDCIYRGPRPSMDYQVVLYKVPITIHVFFFNYSNQHIYINEVSCKQMPGKVEKRVCECMSWTMPRLMSTGYVWFRTNRDLK